MLYDFCTIPSTLKILQNSRFTSHTEKQRLASQWFNMNRVEYDIDRRMNSLLNKSPKSGYIHSRNGASDSQHLCTMKRRNLLKKASNRGYKSKRQQQHQHWRGGKATRASPQGQLSPWHRLSNCRIYLREHQHLDGPQISCQNPILISLIRVPSNSVIFFFFPKSCRENSNPSMVGCLSKESPPFIWHQSELALIPPVGRDYQAPANKPRSPRQKPRIVASIKKLFQTLRFRKPIPSCYPQFSFWEEC